MWLALMLMLCALPLRAEDSAADLVRLRFQLADRIMAGVLDPILGKGRAHAFVDVSVKLTRTGTTNEKLGRGTATRARHKTDSPPGGRPARAESEDELSKGFGFSDTDDTSLPPSGQNGSSGVTASTDTVLTTDSSQRQYSRQAKVELESRDLLSVQLSDMRVVIVHGSSADSKKLAAVRETLLTIFPDALPPGQIVFRAVTATGP